MAIRGALGATGQRAALTFGIGGLDPVAFLSAAVVMLIVPAGAAFLAATRSARLEPMQALRVE